MSSNRRLSGSGHSRMDFLQRSRGVQSMRGLLGRSISSQKDLFHRLSGASSDKTLPQSGSAGNLAALNEEQKLVESIQRFSHHIPRCVLYFILQELEKEREKKPPESTDDSDHVNGESREDEEENDCPEKKVSIQNQRTLQKSNVSGVSDDGDNNLEEAKSKNGENGTLSMKTFEANANFERSNDEDTDKQEDDNRFISGFLRGIGLMKKPGTIMTKNNQQRMTRRNTDIIGSGSNRHSAIGKDIPSRSHSMAVYPHYDNEDIYAQAFLDEGSVNSTYSNDCHSVSSSGASVASSTEAALQRALIIRGVIDGTSFRNSAGSAMSSEISRDLVRQLTIKEKPAIDVKLPEYSRHTTALLFVDISGFTKLSTLLDVETLSKTINAYFELIVSEITGCGGDILKFAGDALFAEWPVKETPKTDGQKGENDLSWLKTEANSIEESLLCAAICGASIVAKCSDFKVPTPKESEESATLNVHCGLGAGEVVALLVGDNDSKKEFLLLGDPIDQVAAAEECASLGELAASPEAIALLSKTCNVGPSIVGSESPAVIAFRSHCDFTPTEANRYDRNLLPIQTLPSHILDEKLASHCEKMDGKTLEELRELLSLYAHPVVRNEEIGSFKAFTNSNNSDSHVGQQATTASSKQSQFATHRQHSSSSIFSLSSMSTARTKECSNVRIESLKKRHQAEAELRSVFVIFIMPKMEAKVTGNKKADEDLFLLLNKVMHVTTRELDRFKGHLRQFIVDDKGVVLIGTFGLRGSTFPNMSSKHALPATLAIHRALKNELGVDNQVGATIGKVYCGVVGGVSQHEFAVLGPSVNLAARLMASPKNPGILVDDNVRTQTTNRFFFKLVSRVMAKGYATLVPIFEPIETKESHVGKLYFVGRKKETYKFIRMASQVVWPEPGDRRGGGFKWSARKNLDVDDDELSSQKKKVHPPTKMMLVTSESGRGKSALLFNVTLRVQRLMGMNQKRSLVLRTASIERERLLLFSTFRRIFVSALSHLKDLPTEMREGTFSAQNSITKRSNSTISSGGMNSMSQLKLSHGNLRISGASLRSGRFSTGASSTMLKNWSLQSMQSSSSSVLNKSVSSMNTSSRGSFLALSRSKLISGTSVRSSLNVETQITYMHRLRWICGKLGRSSDYAVFVGRHLLKLDDESAGADLIRFSHEDILHFIVDAFLCCLDTDVTLITLDDVQWMDSFSWEILELLFQRGKNILVMCASRPTSTYPLGGTPGFWNALRNQHEKESRYAEIDLPNLELNDIRALTANVVGTDEEKIDKSFYVEVFTRSGGNPFFAREMLEEIKQLDMLDVNSSGLIIRRNAKGGEDLPFKIFEEHFLHKLDTLDPDVRTILQLCAVLGENFYLSDLMHIFDDSAITESKEERKRALNDAMDDAISERIINELIAKCAGDSEEDIEEEARGMRTNLTIDPGDRLFKFSNERWLKSVLSTMLDERIRDIHRKVAEVMESCGLPDSERCSIEDHIKLFNHWKMGGNVHKAVSIALYVAMKFSGWDYLDQCLSLLHESLAMVIAKIGGDIKVGINDEAIVSPLLSSANITDVQLLVRIRIEIGSRLVESLDGKLAAGSFLRALAILQQVPERLDDFHDKSIIVDVATGISVLFAQGVISDDDSMTDLRLTEKLVTSARMDGDPCFICAALTYHSSIYAREGDFMKAIEVQKEAEEIYMEDDISGDLTYRFGIDRVALNASQMVQWLAILNEDDNAIENRIHFSVNNIIMHMDRSRVQNNFVILLPLLIVMKRQKGMVSRAKSILVEFVSSKLKLDEDGYSSEVPLLKPLMDILTFEEKIAENTTTRSRLASSNMQKIRNDERRLSKKWILEGKYDIPSALVRDGKALMAELCMFIVCSARKWKGNSEKKKSLQFKGIGFAKESLELMKGNGLCTFYEVQMIEILRVLSNGRFNSSRLKNLMRRSGDMSSVDSDGDDDCSNCRESSTMSLSIPYAEWDESQNKLKTRRSDGRGSGIGIKRGLGLSMLGDDGR